MPDRKPKPDRPTPRKEKICKTCGRPFAYREEWAQDWDIIKFCSDTCRNQKITASAAALEQAILTLLAERTADGNREKTICPSEAAKLVAGDPRNKSHAARRDWEALMEPARAAARHLVAQGRILITQHNRPVDPPPQKAPSVCASGENPSLTTPNQSTTYKFLLRKPQQNRLSSPKTT